MTAQATTGGENEEEGEQIVGEKVDMKEEGDEDEEKKDMEEKNRKVFFYTSNAL